MRINNNIMSMNTHRQLGVANTNGAKSMEKLSSGFRINRAGDDAAGLSISEKMRGQIRGLNQASRNAQDGISLIQTAEGALNETHAILQRMRELAVQSSSDTNVDTLDREAIQNEFSELVKEVDRIAETTEFNTQKLLQGDGVGGGGSATPATAVVSGVTFSATAVGVAGDGVNIAIEQGVADAGNTTVTAAAAWDSGTNTLTYTLGATWDAGTTSSVPTVISNADLIALGFDGAPLTATVTAAGNAVVANGTTGGGVDAPAGGGGGDFEATFQIGANETQTMTIEIGDMRAAALDLDAVDLGTGATARTAITTIDDAINTVSKQRSNLGAYQNRLEHTIKNLDNSAENLQAAESRIRDVDMAKEMMEFTKNNILQQASTAMLAQANVAPQAVLQLLG